MSALRSARPALIAARWHQDAIPGHAGIPRYEVTLRPGNGVPVSIRPAAG